MGVSIFDKLAEEQQHIKFEADATKKLSYKDCILDLSKPAKELAYLFMISGQPTMPKGELVGVKGRAKVGKSQFEYFLIGALLAGCSRGAVKPMQSDFKALLFDTEQSEASLKKCCDRALKLAGLPTNATPKNFLPFFLRPLSVNDRKKIIEEAIMEERPDLVFIDGIRDLLIDFNSLEQSNVIVQWLLKLTADYGCTIVSVLHQNKSKDDSSMRGHLGTELLNKLCDCFEVTKKDGRFVVSCTDSRNIPCRDFAFSIDAEGMFVPEEVASTRPCDARAAETQRVLKLCYQKKSSYSYRELVSAYQLEAAKSESTAKRRIEEAKRKDFLVVGSDDKYRLNPPHT